MKNKKENLILKQKEHPPPVGFEPQPLSVRPNKRYLIWRGKRFCQNLTFLMAIFNFTLICYKLATLSGFKISSISFNWFWSQVAATYCSMKKTSLKKPILLVKFTRYEFYLGISQLWRPNLSCFWTKNWLILCF